MSCQGWSISPSPLFSIPAHGLVKSDGDMIGEEKKNLDADYEGQGSKRN
jgi:hypothetical protein